MFESLSNFFADLKSKKKGKRSPFIIFIIALIVIIPTVFAIFYGYFYEDTTFLASKTVKIELYDEKGSLLFSKEGNQSYLSDSKTLEMLYTIHDEKVEIDRELSELSSPNFKISVKGEGINEEYECFFGESTKASYIKDKAGKIYSLPKEAYESFLTSEYCESVYTASTPPALTTGNGEIVYPSSVKSWQYRRIDGKMAEANKVATASGSATYKIGGAINLFFETNPDECYVIISDSNSDTVYEGTLDELPFLTVEKGVVLTARIDAEWKSSSVNDFSGALSYNFKIVVGDRSEFTVSSTDIYPGQFIVITVTNVDDVSKIIFSSKARRDIAQEGDAFAKLYEFVPTFVKDGKIATAILPFPNGLPEYSFNFSLSYGAAQELFSINILKPKESGIFSSDIPAENVLFATSSSAEKKFSSIVNGIPSSPQDMILCESGFISPVDLGFTSGYSYNDMVLCDVSGTSFIAKGNEYIAPTSEGKSVPALSNGRVVKTGTCDALGKYAVVDHGLGLRTWYCFLSSVDVTEGAVVTKGESVGKCGSGGLLSSDGVLILCSVYKTFIDPDFILENKIVL